MNMTVLSGIVFPSLLPLYPKSCESTKSKATCINRVGGFVALAKIYRLSFQGWLFKMRGR